jgi:hypothetical protein
VRGLDDDEYVLVASYNLSAALDVVNVRLLIKRLKIMGLPDDVIQLIQERLTDRCYHVDINSTTSTLFDLLLSTVQIKSLPKTPTLFGFCKSLKLEPNYPHDTNDYMTLHKITNRATLKCIVVINLQTFKTLNSQLFPCEWTQLNCQQNGKISRQTNFWYL